MDLPDLELRLTKFATNFAQNDQETSLLKSFVENFFEFLGVDPHPTQTFAEGDGGHVRLRRELHK